MKHLYTALFCTLFLGTLSASVMPAEYHLERMTEQQKEFLMKNRKLIQDRYQPGDIMHEITQELDRDFDVARQGGQPRFLGGFMQRLQERARQARQIRGFMPEHLQQFVFEHPQAFVRICGVVGGIAGLALGVGLSAAIEYFTEYPMFNLWS